MQLLDGFYRVIISKSYILVSSTTIMIRSSHYYESVQLKFLVASYECLTSAKTVSSRVKFIFDTIQDNQKKLSRHGTNRLIVGGSNGCGSKRRGTD